MIPAGLAPHRQHARDSVIIVSKKCQSAHHRARHVYPRGRPSITPPPPQERAPRACVHRTSHIAHRTSRVETLPFHKCQFAANDSDVVKVRFSSLTQYRKTPNIATPRSVMGSSTCEMNMSIVGTAGSGDRRNVACAWAGQGCQWSVGVRKGRRTNGCALCAVLCCAANHFEREEGCFMLPLVQPDHTACVCSQDNVSNCAVFST